MKKEKLLNKKIIQMKRISMQFIDCGYKWQWSEGERGRITWIDVNT